MVSIIVPVYGVEQYLSRCIDRILAQTYREFELILIDDESPDRCGEICDEYALRDCRIKVIHKKNGGVSAARNTGLDVAAGEYVAFCDSDDYWHPDYLQCMVEEARRTEADVVACNYVNVDDQGNDLGGLKLIAETITIDDSQSRFDFLVCNVLSGKKSWSIWNRLFKADIIRAKTIHFCTDCGNYAEDLGFVIQFSSYASVFSYIPNRLYFYVNHSGSMMDRSKNVLKFNQMNELSQYLYPQFCDVFRDKRIRSCYPVIHFMMMIPEYKKLLCTPRYATMGTELAHIQDKRFYHRHMRRVWRCYGVLKRCFGKNLARRSLLAASYAHHGNWNRFKIESYITYKWLVKE